jgi:hypothetical protein
VDDILTEPEIVALTGKVKHRAQARELDRLHIKATPRGNGSLIVLRVHRDAALGLRKTMPRTEQAAAPNFAALDS